MQNFGFSDAAEIFVFLAGYAAVLAYGKILLRDGYVFACVKILRRVWTLYVVHIFLLALLMGIVIFANSHIETRDLVQEMGLEYLLTHTQQALLDELLLRFKPNLTDPLPLYIVLMMSLPITLPLLVRAPTLMVAISLAVYLLAPWQGWNLPASNGGVWYFNPVTWQCLFILGGASALRSPGPVDARPLLRQPLFVAAAVYVLVTCVITLSWRWPEVHDAWMPRAIGEWLYPISKTDLSPCACCTSWPWPTSPPNSFPMSAGRNSGWPDNWRGWGVIPWKCFAWGWCWHRWPICSMPWPATPWRSS